MSVKTVLMDMDCPNTSRFTPPNSEVGIAALIDQLRPLSVALVVVEATGGLERQLVSALQKDLRSRWVKPRRTIWIQR